MGIGGEGGERGREGGGGDGDCEFEVRVCVRKFMVPCLRRFRRMDGLGPGEFGREEGHTVLWVFRIYDITLSLEFRASSAPAGMMCVFAVNAALRSVRVAFSCAVRVAACPASICWVSAVLCDMSEALTFDASNRFFLVLLNRDVVALDA